jgi:hypothetical protein
MNGAACTLDVAARCRAVLLREEHSADDHRECCRRPCPASALLDRRRHRYWVVPMDETRQRRSTAVRRRTRSRVAPSSVLRRRAGRRLRTGNDAGRRTASRVILDAAACHGARSVRVFRCCGWGGPPGERHRSIQIVRSAVRGPGHAVAPVANHCPTLYGAPSSYRRDPVRQAPEGLLIWFIGFQPAP